MLLISRDLPDVIALSSAKKLLRSVVPPFIPKQFKDVPETDLLDLLMKQLLVYAETVDVDLLSYKSYDHACGCMGPARGDTFCGCVFSYLLKEFKEDLALIYLNQQRTNS